MGFTTTALLLATISVLFTVIQSQEHIRIKRRMYAMCPPKFQRIGSECYAISDQPANWLEAHFQCKDKNSKLAEPNNKSDRKLRAFFQRMDHDSDEIWIGATFDWHINTWQWSISGKNLSYDAFSRLDPESRQNLEYHCAVLNPSLKYRWSARSCVDKHRYICQHKMPKVSEKNRFKVYDRWNQTYPNQLANEVELEVIDTKTKDGTRTHRRVKPMDSGENYPIRRPSQPPKMRRRPHTPQTVTNNDINVKFIPNYMTNEINTESFKPNTPATIYPLQMDFIPADIAIADNNVQAAQAYMDTTTTRSRKTTTTPSSENETVDQIKPKRPNSRQRARTTFDKLNAAKRKQEREQRRAAHRRAKKMKAMQEEKLKKQEEELKKQEEERKKQEEERKNLEEQRKALEEQRKKQEQDDIEALKRKHAEDGKQVKEHELAALLQRQKLDDDKKEQERQDEEEKRLKEKRDEEEEQLQKRRLIEEKRLRLEYEEKIQQQQTDRERQLEEEKRVNEENRRRLEQDERARQEELKRLQEEDEKRLELQRMEVERKRQEDELARLEEENRKRIAAQKAREEEIRRREETLEKQLAEEKRLEEELRVREEQDRLLHEQELQREEDERKQKEEAERKELEQKEELRKQREKKLKAKLDIEAKHLEKEEEERKKKEKIRKYAERISRLSPEMQRAFIEARRKRKKNKNTDNEASIPERK